MRIGILPVLTGAGGGIYQYSLNMLQALQELNHNEGDDEFAVFTNDLQHPALIPLINDAHWGVYSADFASPAKRMAKLLLHKALPAGGFDRLAKGLRSRSNKALPINDLDLIRHNTAMNRHLRRRGIKLMVYPAPSALSFEAGIPFIMAVHDLQHRLHPEFPEVAADGNFQRREYLFRNAARYATLLLADSEVGKEDILNLYGSFGITSARVKVLPFLPACYLVPNVLKSEGANIRAAYNLPEKYFFYPAQFWPHKNHIGIVRALRLFKQTHQIEAPIVFCGSHEGELRTRTFKEVMALARRLGVEHQVIYLGLVPDKQMSALYAEAVALVMPTFFGPTNIPVLEAWAFGCPVLTSDIRGIQDQVGNAGLLVDPKSVEAIAEGLDLLWTNEYLRRELAVLGSKRLKSYTTADYIEKLEEILNEAKALICR